MPPSVKIFQHLPCLHCIAVRNWHGLGSNAVAHGPLSSPDHPSAARVPARAAVGAAFGARLSTAVLANAAQGRRALEVLEDPLVDRLAWRAIAAGIGAVISPCRAP